MRVVGRRSGVTYVSAANLPPMIRKPAEDGGDSRSKRLSRQSGEAGRTGISDAGHARHRRNERADTNRRDGAECHPPAERPIKVSSALRTARAERRTGLIRCGAGVSRERAPGAS
ncbi:MAG: hypothetical protein JWP39_3465, partial [Jatrophihabitans sp.]|nr:hypothetical protein [Jatrophihabitans sp.]